MAAKAYGGEGKCDYKGRARSFGGDVLYPDYGGV